MNIRNLLAKRSIKLGSFIILAITGYFIYQSWGDNSSATRYVVANAAKGTIITSLSGSGQISVTNQADVKARAAGDAYSIAVKNGDEVKTGQILAQLNAQDALKSVRDAEANYQSAKLSLDKIKQPASAYSILQAENSLVSAQTNLEKIKFSQASDYQKAKDTQQKSEDNLTKSYEDVFNAMANAFLDLPTIITDLNGLLYGYEISSYQTNQTALMNIIDESYRSSLLVFQTSVENDYASARAKYDANFINYKNASRYSSREVIEALLAETLETTKTIAQAAKSQTNYLDAWSDFRTKMNQPILSQVTVFQSSLSDFIGQTNGHLSSLLSVQRTLQDNQDSIVSAISDIKEMEQNNPLDLAAAEATIKEREAALVNLKNGSEAIDIQSQELSLQQRLNALLDARAKLSDYTVRAPFAGAVASVGIKIGDSVSSGAVVATVITKQRLAEISLNEVDAAKIKVGQKATLTFDAIEDFNLTGAVAEIDALGTVSQGVVTYKIKIVFDTQDERVKPGMSVSAVVATDIKTDVLTVPNSAVKSQGNSYYVEIFDRPIDASSGSQGAVSLVLPRQQAITIGLINDTDTEVVSGLKEGDQIVVRTVAAVVSAAASSTPSATSLFGASRGATGGVRVQGR